jgi:hypothetical protein
MILLLTALLALGEIAAPEPPAEQTQARSLVGSGLGLYAGGLFDPLARTAGGQVSLVVGAKAPWTFLAGVTISPHPSARASAARRVLDRGWWTLAVEPRVLLGHFSTGTVAGGGAGLRVSASLTGWLELVGSAGAEVYAAPGGPIFAPLFAIGLEPHG